MKKLISFQHFGNISTDSESPDTNFLKKWSKLFIYIAIKNQKLTKHTIFLMIFLLKKQFFEKIITEGGLKLIVLNPFLDSLCNSALKNIGLAPGIPKTCFQHPQDIVYTQ